MKSFVMEGLGKTNWIEKERPKCGPCDAILKPIALAPCTSDIHTVYEGAIGDRHDLILGHEGVGEIVELGTDVKDFKIGDRVIISAITPNWNSLEAQRGYPMHSNGMLAGWKFSNIKDGVFAELIHVNDADGNLALLPTDVDPAVGCMISDMVPTGLHGCELANINYGDEVLVIGIGPVGLMAVAGAAIRGASRIYAVGSRPKCVEVAEIFGATHIINYKNGSIEDQVMKLTNNKGVDKVIIAGGDNNIFETACKVTKPGSIIANVNYLGSGEYIQIPRTEWGVGMGHKTIIGGLMPGGRLRSEKLVSLVQTKRINPELLITHKFRGIDKLPEALELMHHKPADLIKPVVIIED